MINYRHTDLLLALLRLALWADKEPFLALSPVSPEEWQAAYNLAACHAVTGVAWQGICQLDAAELPPTELLCIWTAKATALEKSSERMNQVLSALMERLGSAGLRPVVMKGQTVAALYPKPLLRETGDIDLYFPERADMDACISALEPATASPDGSYRARYMGVEVEINPTLIDLTSGRKTRSVSASIAPEQFIEVDAAPGLRLRASAPQVNLLLLSSHILKHTFGRGIGLRQMCDLAMACRAYRGKIDPAHQARASRRMGLRVWDRHLYSFLVRQLGMPAEYVPYKIRLSKSHTLSQRVLLGGNFGRMVYSPSANSVKSKGVTALSLLRSSLWSLRIAPRKYLKCISSLALGQFRLITPKPRTRNIRNH
ncbi:MAG: nucleotidyltransferase family protein [Bacteroidales bacterium]|nr:nucleotidyltransferase family protein [Bacteroidales bacterium]